MKPSFSFFFSLSHHKSLLILRWVNLYLQIVLIYLFIFSNLAFRFDCEIPGLGNVLDISGEMSLHGDRPDGLQFGCSSYIQRDQFFLWAASAFSSGIKWNLLNLERGQFHNIYNVTERIHSTLRTVLIVFEWKSIIQIIIFFFKLQLAVCLI